MLSRENTDREKLSQFALEAAEYATEGQLPILNFAINHRGEEDAAIFDFTAMNQANFSCYFKERLGKKLFLSIVGDSLIEVNIVGLYFHVICSVMLGWENTCNS